MTRRIHGFERAAAAIPLGASRAEVRTTLGEPLVVSELSDGGESWLYVEAGSEPDLHESLFAEFDARARFTGVTRKPID